MRGKKRFLSIAAGIGIASTALLILVDTGDWLLASIFFVLGRIGFTGANVFYDALLPHVAKEEDRDRVSTRGYAMGYLGGGLLLAINVVMLQFLPGTWGPRLSFFSVAVWWAVFSIPLFRRIPEPPAATVSLTHGETIIGVSFRRLVDTLRDVSRYRQLFKFLIAYLIYNDGIGTIIGIAVIYGAELGFGETELVLALLLVQFVGIPFSVIFGRLPSKGERRRPVYLAFIVFNLIALPLAGIVGVRALPADLAGAPLPPYEDTATAVGEGVYAATSDALALNGDWETVTVSADDAGTDDDVPYAVTDVASASYELAFNGQKLELFYSTGPDRGLWAVEIDGVPLLEEDSGEPLTIDGFNSTVRYGVRSKLQADSPGEHVLRLVNTGERHEDSTGALMTLAQVAVQPPIRQSNLGVVLGIIVGIEIVGFIFALLVGRRLFAGLAQSLDTKRSVILALIVYAVIAIWGFFLNSVVEFWMLAWMVAIVQGGSQALSRSLYSAMSPATKSGEFFGLYGIMEKFSSFLGPALFAAAAVVFDSSRPAVLSLIAFFIVGIWLLRGVDVDEGRRVARAEDAALLDASAATEAV
jgi:MFS-type transporter involved in bile tolerance (Atg22 family)